MGNNLDLDDMIEEDTFHCDRCDFDFTVVLHTPPNGYSDEVICCPYCRDLLDDFDPMESNWMRPDD